MNDADAYRLVGLFAAAWPWAEWPDATIALWVDELRNKDADTAAVAARRCVLELERPPSLAGFLDRYNAQRRAGDPFVKALPAASEPDTWDTPKSHIQRLRQMLEEAGGAKPASGL